jgi:2-C-methyl-D-erythritol 2,4-cyclodiphosphate synthase
MKNTLRIGQGFDVHAFASGRKLVLGGVEIAHTKGLQGHSDADVLLHALTDAILGALSWGDIGQWFPDTSDEFRGADSKELLRRVWKKASADGWTVVNCDCTILAEQPKIGPHMDAMKAGIAPILGVGADAIGLKATTTEKLGFIGREEGIAAMAVVLLVRAQ